MERNNAIVWGTVIIMLLASVVAFMFPVPASWPLSAIEFYLPFVGNVIMACLHIGAAVLLTTNLDVYKTKLRRAYIGLAGSTIVVGLGTLQISIIAVLDIWRSPYVLGGGMMLPFLAAGLGLYFSVRYLALLVGVKSILTKAWSVVPVTLIIAYMTSFLPHVQVTLTETAFDMGVGMIAWSAALMFFGGILVVNIQRHVGALYIRPMVWLSRAYLVSSLVLAIQCVYYLITTDYDHIVTRVNSVILIVGGLLWLRAAYAFALTKYYKEDIPLLRLLFGQSEPATTRKPKTVIDMVTYAAGLVSNSSEIDPTLDEVRAITAKLKPNESPSDDQTDLLIAVYLKIEHYLTTKEAIRKFTQKELRTLFDPSLQKMISTHEAAQSLATEDKI